MNKILLLELIFLTYIMLAACTNYTKALSTTSDKIFCCNYRSKDKICGSKHCMVGECIPQLFDTCSDKVYNMYLVGTWQIGKCDFCYLVN